MENRSEYRVGNPPGSRSATVSIHSRLANWPGGRTTIGQESVGGLKLLEAQSLPVRWKLNLVAATATARRNQQSRRFEHPRLGRIRHGIPHQ